MLCFPQKKCHKRAPPIPHRSRGRLMGHHAPPATTPPKTASGGRRRAHGRAKVGSTRAPTSLISLSQLLPPPALQSCHSSPPPATGARSSLLLVGSGPPMAGSVVGAGAPPVAAPVQMRRWRRLLSVQVGHAVVRRPWPLPAPPPVAGGGWLWPRHRHLGWPGAHGRAAAPPRVAGDSWPLCRRLGWPPLRMYVTTQAMNFAMLFNIFMKHFLKQISLR